MNRMRWYLTSVVYCTGKGLEINFIMLRFFFPKLQIADGNSLLHFIYLSPAKAFGIRFYSFDIIISVN